MFKIGKITFLLFKFLLLVFLLFDVFFLGINLVSFFKNGFSSSSFLFGVFLISFFILTLIAIIRIFKHLPQRYTIAAVALALSFFYIEAYKFFMVTKETLTQVDLNNLLLYLPFVIIAIILQRFANLDVKQEKSVPQQWPQQESNAADEEKILARVLRIKTVGFASISYWNIIVSNMAVYFLQIGTNYLPLGYGAIADAIYWLGGKGQEKEQSLSYFLAGAAQAIKVTKEQLNCIEFGQGFFKKNVLFRTGDKIYKFKLSSKNFDLLKSVIEQLKISV